MLKFVCKHLILVLFVSMAIASANPIFADSSTATSGQPTIVGVKFKIVITPSLALQIKTGSTDTLLASRSVMDSSNATLLNPDNKNIQVSASANLTKRGVLNVSSNLLSDANPPTVLRRAEQDPIESFPMPYLPNGRYQLDYTPNDPITPLSSDASSIFILCSP